ncbi:MAG: proteasome accessory factor PafA2 family protein [Pirellulaceae bacterium]|nr:proteasome accessory factor PafA2 family protein [Pirellulaceae bacterium]
MPSKIPLNTWPTRWFRTVANKSDVFQRLIGLETEYALVVPSLPRGRPSRYGVYRDLVAALRRQLPTVPARHMKEGIFHAAGGAVWFETERPAVGGGLIEGATPECRSPRQALAWQRAQDEMLAQAADDAFGGAVRLVKNDRDAEGNIYGAQENYEATLATGWRLWMWRGALVLLLPIVLATWLCLWLLDRCVIGYALGATVVYLAAERLLARPEWLSHLLFGCDIKDLESDLPTGPVWLEGLLTFTTRVVTAPLAALLFAALWLTAFGRIRQQMTAFLVSRPLIGGAGTIDGAGNFQLADKAVAVNCVTGLGGFVRDRPILSLGHFYKVVNADARQVLGEFRQLFAARQRLQVALGDSNMADTAEYLRIGTTLLVLDCIEAGEMPRPPRIRRPIRALHAICADPTLAARVPVAGGGTASALELQRFYLEACRRFVERRPGAPAEARDLVARWEAVLDTLADDPQSLVGALDWVTKQFVLDKSARRASWEARKKIDIRYHELSPDGYFQRLRATGVVRDLLTRAEIEHARRNPPSGTPAAERGRYIREFAVDDDTVAANWRAIFLSPHDGPRRVIRLDRLVAGPAPAAGSSRRKTKRKDSNG